MLTNRMIDMKQLMLAILISSLSMSVQAENLRGSESYWQCASFDRHGKQWIAQSSFQRVALNKAFRQCKHDSSEPSSCEVAKEHCEATIKGYKMPMWRCSAFDKMAKMWKSDTFRLRDDAAVGAKRLCKHQSAFPESCYVRLMTCKAS